MLGTNGGGFFNANSAHPFENPTPLSNFAQMIAIFLIPASLCFAFGRLIGDPRQGWAIFGAMTFLFIVMAVGTIWAEQQGKSGIRGVGGGSNPQRAAVGREHGGQRDPIRHRGLSFVCDHHHRPPPVARSMPCTILSPRWADWCRCGSSSWGEVVFGGVGSGLYGMLIFAIMAVFIAGLMIGRTPEYLGKKIESFEIKMTSIVILITPMLVLLGTAVAVSTEPGRLGIANPGAHGFSEILYAFSSAANNNGSAFAGLSTDTPFYNSLLAVAMWFGRFAFIVPVLAIAGSLAKKKKIEATVGTLPTHGPLFVALLIGTVVLVGALTYVPALALGPVIEHLQLHSNH